MTSFKDKYKDCWSHSKICSNSATCYLGICIGRGYGGREAILDDKCQGYYVKVKVYYRIVGHI